MAIIIYQLFILLLFALVQSPTVVVAQQGEFYLSVRKE